MVNKGTKLNLIMLTAVVLAGCIQQRPRSAYRDLYESRLASIRVPTYEEIAATQDRKEVTIQGQSSHLAWEALLDLAIQSKGILGVEDDPGGGHRILLVSGQNLEYKSGLPLFVDRWIVVSIKPTTENSTKVLVAYVSPHTARVAPLYSDSFPKGFKGDPQRSISSKAAGNLLTALQEAFKENEYLEHLGEESTPSARGVPLNPDDKHNTKNQSLAEKRGNFESARTRRAQLVLDLPRLEARIANVVKDLARAADQLNRETRIFIVVGTLDGIHVEPNGDIFITTDTLDQIKDIDELAGLLAHELAHLYLHHGPTRIRGFRLAGMSRNSILALGSLGGAIIGGMIPTSKPQPASPQDTLLSNREVLIGAAVGLGATYLGGRVGDSFGVGVGGFTVQRFSRKDELTADEYGMELLWAAGYDYRGFLRYLQRNPNRLEGVTK